MARRAKRPVALLDVDGVFAPFGCRPGPPQGYDFLEIPDAGMILFSFEEHPKSIQRLMRVCDLHWATGWEDQANEFLLEYLGLEDPLPVIYFDHRLENEGLAPPIEGASVRLSGRFFDEGVDTWKLPWIKQWDALNEGRPFVWIDDEIMDDALRWAEERTANGVPTLLVRTNADVGITEEHLQQIETWAKELETA